MKPSRGPNFRESSLSSRERSLLPSNPSNGMILQTAFDHCCISNPNFLSLAYIASSFLSKNFANFRTDLLSIKNFFIISSLNLVHSIYALENSFLIFLPMSILTFFGAIFWSSISILLPFIQKFFLTSDFF